MNIEGYRNTGTVTERHIHGNREAQKMTKRETEIHIDTQTEKDIDTCTERHIHRY